METIEKIDVRKMKADIKVMVEEQRMYVNQRKTKRLIGERTMEPSTAQWKHKSNRQKLRLMYAAYGIARGKKFEQVENNHKIPPHPLEQWCVSIDSIINRYKIQVPVEVQTQE